MVKFNMCDHLNQIIDQHEGSIVCGDCALVLDVYFSQQEHSSQKISVSLQHVDHLKSYLLDCCDRMHIPTLISENIYKKFIQFRTGRDFERISDMHLMTYSIYITLKNDGIGRNIEYVAQNTGISSKLLWKCESLDPYISMPINIENVLAPVYSMFNLSSEDCKIIVKISKHGNFLVLTEHFSRELPLAYSKKQRTPMCCYGCCTCCHLSQESKISLPCLL